MTPPTHKMASDARILELELEVKRLRPALDEALARAEEHHAGCLYCGEGEIVDGATTSEHQKQCWWYKARALLDSSPPHALAEAYMRLRGLLQGDSWSHVRVKATLAEIERLEK